MNARGGSRSKGSALEDGKAGLCEQWILGLLGIYAFNLV